MKKSFLFVSCDEAMHICDKSQYGESTGWERVKLSIRLSWCKITKAYFKRNNKLTDVVQKSNINVLKNAERNKLQEQFEKENWTHDHRPV